MRTVSVFAKAKSTFGWGLRTSILLLIMWTSLQSAVLVNVPVSVTQPNGEKLALYASGDEFYNWLHDQAGYTIIQDHDTGYYVYAKDDKGRLVSSGVAVTVNEGVNAANVKALALPKGLQVAPDLRPKPSEIFTEGSPANQKQILQAPKTGSLNNLVIFIRFAGEAEFTDALSIYDNMFNTSSAGYNSMRNYFQEASYSALTISTSFYPTPTTTVVSYQSSNLRNYYQPYDAVTNPSGYTGGDNGTMRRDREHALLQSAVDSVSSQVPTGLNLDGDSDGYVDNVCFVVDGDPTGWSSLLWPHMWSLYSVTANINSKRVWTYNFQLQNSLKNSGVGVLCHEMFHSLGAPDLYHYYSYTNLHPVYTWGLMEYDSNPPRHMLSYMKYKYGTWIAAIPEITTPGTYTLNPLSSSTNNCYKIRSPWSASEYWVVEYRKKTTTFENSLPGEGLLVIRINPAYNGNANGPPDEVYIYRPNGTTTADGSPGSANFNATAGRTAISDTTNPSSFLTDGTPGGLSISGIGAVGSTISFTVDFPYVSTSLLKVKATNTGTSVTVSPNDLFGNGNGTTDFTRYYLNGQAVTLTAPAVSGALGFSRWYQDGIAYSTSPTASVTMNANHTLLATYGLGLGEAVDNTTLSWGTEGRGWFGQATTYYSGNDAAQSAPITHNEKTYLTTTVVGPGTVTWQWMVSSESSYDWVNFYVDSTRIFGYSGSGTWSLKTRDIPAGVHTLKWSYEKDGSVSSGSDCAWVDLVTYSGSGWYAKDDLLGTWDGQGVYFRNSETGAWRGLTSPADVVACGDLSGDGVDDLIGIWSGQAWVKNSADGSWTYLAVATRDVAAGDMNGDGRIDFLGTWDGQGVYYKDSISGSWVALTSPVEKIAAGDLDGDGKADLIGVWTGQGLWVKYSKTGAWGLISYAAPRDFTVGDMNGDGRVDFVGTWDGQGVFYQDSVSGAWVQITSPADQVAAGDLDGDGIDDLLGNWSGQGLWVKYSKTLTWAQITTSAHDLAAGRLSGGAWSSGLGSPVKLTGPSGGTVDNPGAGLYRDLSDQGPRGKNFIYRTEKNLTPQEPESHVQRVPGPGEPGFLPRQEGVSQRPGKQRS